MLPEDRDGPPEFHTIAIPPFLPIHHKTSFTKVPVPDLPPLPGNAYGGGKGQPVFRREGAGEGITYRILVVRLKRKKPAQVESHARADAPVNQVSLVIAVAELRAHAEFGFFADRVGLVDGQPCLGITPRIGICALAEKRSWKKRHGHSQYYHGGQIMPPA